MLGDAAATQGLVTSTVQDCLELSGSWHYDENFIPNCWLLDETRNAMDRKARTLRPPEDVMAESIRVRNPVMTP
jgi:hypothetical protein